MGARAAIVWDAAFLGYDLGGDHPLDPIRLDLTMRMATAFGLLDGVETVPPRPATDDELERVHTPAYVAAVRAAPTAGWDPGHGLGTADNPVFDRMHESSALIAGGSIAAARQIVTGAAQRAVNLAGGLHHAMADHAAGFCVYNDCAVAIAWLLDQGVERIAYLDVDVHHGDGVQAAFYTDPRVLTVSVHQHPMTLWPGTGYPAELGAEGAEGTAVNLALPPGTRDDGWLRAFHAVVPSLLAAFRPQVLVTQCGADTHREDPLADLGLSVDGHRAIYRTLRELADTHAGGRWLALGGGGYSLFRVVPRSWTHLLATVLDRDVDPNRPVPADWVAHAAPLAPTVPLPTAMTDGCDPGFAPWDGSTDTPLDAAVLRTRRALFPLHGLDPDDPRD
ncbi:acetoin utilization protein AcuC [Streptoalloteichus tenebrarius]|uniref:Acetoin utilization protein AcuC n=1 Tax=Streptoalloteichus tenebrarius (strain ATCC 17920 / DSM 40477 / JCM 4838 / CBS 697.72 / NBRC 16177 / NCIMB 11028 / NRRL B-12390 / A12253. 1 / ISP 5477) TaxID=1933 RepID=A0ABT1HMS5_STRSD|nr:acetoin utilization protein AcuC [Streptoalloteichus tenebrarius]MCP2256811.1 acetoin utilization protein AcuC [Streptoalloteichus tenebrarius]BFF00281.1 acetoin utilization protein AcuC [Streptoalloteichus tenebrarius]